MHGFYFVNTVFVQHERRMAGLVIVLAHPFGMPEFWVRYKEQACYVWCKTWLSSKDTDCTCCDWMTTLMFTRFGYTVEPLTNDHPHQRPSLSYDHILCDGQWFLFVYESLTSDHPSYTTTPMWFWGWSYKRGSTVSKDENRSQSTGLMTQQAATSRTLILTTVSVHPWFPTLQKWLLK